MQTDASRRWRSLPTESASCHRNLLWCHHFSPFHPSRFPRIESESSMWFEVRDFLDLRSPSVVPRSSYTWSYLRIGCRCSYRDSLTSNNFSEDGFEVAFHSRWGPPRLWYRESSALTSILKQTNQNDVSKKLQIYIPHWSTTHRNFTSDSVSTEPIARSTFLTLEKHLGNGRLLSRAYSPAPFVEKGKRSGSQGRLRTWNTPVSPLVS